MDVQTRTKQPVPPDEIDRVLPLKKPLAVEQQEDRPFRWWADGNLFDLLVRGAVRLFAWLTKAVS